MPAEPKIETRNEQPYAAIRFEVPMEQLPIIIPQGIVEVENWLGKQGIKMAGAPFIKYNVINMPGFLDVEVGWPVISAVKVEGRFSGGAFPAGRYVTAMFTGDYPGLMDATGKYLAWVAKQGLVLDQFDSDQGDGFVCRYESYLTNPEEEPDRSKHETLIVMKVVGA